MRCIPYFIILFVLFHLPSSLFAQRQESPTARLMRQCEEARSLSQYELLEQYSAQLISQSPKDTRISAYAHFYNGLAGVFLGRGEQSLKILDQAYSLAGQASNDSVKALVMNARAIYQALMFNNNFVAQQYFFASLRLAQEAGYEDLQYRVRGNLLTMSHSAGAEIDLENARAVYDYGQSHNNPEQIAMGTFYLAYYYYENQQYDEAGKYLNIALDTYRQHPYDDIASVYVLYAKMLLVKGETEEAEEMARKSIALASEYHQTVIEVDAAITLAEVQNRQGLYEESIATIQSTMQKVDGIGLTNKIIDCNQLLATNYTALNDTGQAAQYLQKANDLLKEQSKFNMKRLMMEQQTMYDIEKKDMEAKIRQEQINSQQRFLVILSIAIVILVASLVFVIVSYRRRQLLYKKIVLQNYRAVTRQKYLEEEIKRYRRQLSANGESPTPQSPSGSTTPREAFVMDDGKLNALYTSLCRLMEEEKLYTEAQLNRERVAELLGTNRTYLTKVIKEKTGMNYLQFVNSYRINEAIRILSDKDMTSYPLKQIWSDLGFSSPSTFYKLFQQSVGITPSSYRKQFLKVNSESTAEPDDEDIDN